MHSSLNDEFRILINNINMVRTRATSAADGGAEGSSSNATNTVVQDNGNGNGNGTPAPDVLASLNERIAELEPVQNRTQELEAAFARAQERFEAGRDVVV